MALADAADRRIARHLADVLGSKGDETDPRAATRRGRAASHPAWPAPITRTSNMRWRLADLAKSENRLRRLFHVKHYFPRQKRPNRRRAHLPFRLGPSGDRTPSVRAQRSLRSERGHQLRRRTPRLRAIRQVRRLPAVERDRIVTRQKDAPVRLLVRASPHADACHGRHRQGPVRRDGALGPIGMSVDKDSARWPGASRVAEPDEHVRGFDQRRVRSTPIRSTGSSDSRRPAVSVSKSERRPGTKDFYMVAGCSGNICDDHPLLSRYHVDQARLSGIWWSRDDHPDPVLERLDPGRSSQAESSSATAAQSEASDGSRPTSSSST